MGNNPSTPVPELVYQAAKAGNFHELQNLAKLGNELRPSDEGYVHRSQLLEWEDPDGRTALLVAVKKNHTSCVDLLLQSGANVQHQSKQKVGCGSALHFAVYFQCPKEIISLLLRFGASPFVENISGLTALDYALTQKRAPIIRLFESLGLFANYLNVRTTAFMGFKTSWSTRWVAVTPRFPYPNLPPNQQVVRRVLQVFPNPNSFNPEASLYLDGARTEVSPSSRNGKHTVSLVLHPNHVLPQGSLSVAGSATSGYRLTFQTASIVNARQVLDQFVHVVDRHLAPGSAPQRQSPAEHVRSPSGGYILPRTIPPAVNSNYPVVIHSPVEPRNEAPQGHQTDASGDTRASCAPSAPPLPMHNHVPPSTIRSHGQYGEDVSYVAEQEEPESDDDQLCVVCLSSPKEAGFVHGTSVHRCCCVACARSIMESGNKMCPVCRQKIEHVIEHFFD